MQRKVSIPWLYTAAHIIMYESFSVHRYRLAKPTLTTRLCSDPCGAFLSCLYPAVPTPTNVVINNLFRSCLLSIPLLPKLWVSWGELYVYHIHCSLARG